MKVRKLRADVLDATKARAEREMSPRELRRLAIERQLETVLRRAARDPESAFRLDLEEGEKPATVRQAFNRVRERVGVSDVNLFTRGSALIVAKRPQTRGRRKGS